jgi:hypothetical protein
VGLDEAEANLPEVPRVLIAVQLAPSALGQPRVDLIAADGGNGAVDAAFADPPTTAEHMFDAPSYLAREAATPLDDPTLPDGVAGSIDEGPMSPIDLYLLLADRIDPLVALDAADGWGNGRYVSYERDGRTCVRMVFDGDSDQDDQQIRDGLTSWAGAMVAEAGATTSDLGGGHTLVETCDPGTEVTATNNRALDMLSIPAVRAQIAGGSASGGSDVEAAWSEGDCFVHQLTAEQLIEANGSADPPSEVMDAINEAFSTCGTA